MVVTMAEPPRFVPVPQRPGGRKARSITLIPQSRRLIVKADIMRIPLDHLSFSCITDDTWDSLVSLRNHAHPSQRLVDDTRCKLYGHEFIAMRGASLCRVCCLYRRSGH